MDVVFAKDDVLRNALVIFMWFPFEKSGLPGATRQADRALAEQSFSVS